MLTRQQLEAIKQNKLRALNGAMEDITIEVCADIDALLLHIEQLQAVLQAKDAALAQFADSENWTYDTGSDYYEWNTADNPIQLAEKALTHG